MPITNQVATAPCTDPIQEAGMTENSRRLFLKTGLMSLMAVPLSRHWTGGDRVTVTLEGRAQDLGNETVSFGLPLPFGFLNDSRDVGVVDERGKKLSIAVRSLESWRTGGREGSIRSLLIQFKAEFSSQKKQQVTVIFNAGPRVGAKFVPVSQTLIDAEGLQGPRVMAVLPADWLCASGIVGPQVPASLSGAYASYDSFVEKNFPGSLKYLDSKVYSEWLFDRTTCYYKMYVRTGET